MLVIRTISQLTEHVRQIRSQNQTIGFVPTMGSLHKGHLSLISKAKKENNIIICSIFVNPIQFNKEEDFTFYPRHEENDISLLKDASCDILFYPSVEELYPNGKQNLLSMGFGSLENAMEGAFREGHFSGVGVVVAKFFNLTKPTKAYFGQKDLQQVFIIKKMVQDLNFDIEVVVCPTIREVSGLAMSSRNERLIAEEKAEAPQLYQSLVTAANALKAGNTIIEARKKSISYLSTTTTSFQSPEYIDFVDTRSLAVITDQEKAPALQDIAICIAAGIGKVRLIDNLLLKEMV